MKAVRIHEYGGPEKLLFEENVPDPVMLPDAVLIESSAASVNPIDWKVRSGARQKDFPRTLPTILGRDVSGIVRAVGVNVRNFKPGERVLAVSDGTYAELVAVDQAVLSHLPDGVDLLDAAAIPLIALTGKQLVHLGARVERGQTVLVSGALGSVGRAAVHAARKLGATVIAGVRTSQLGEARTLGAARVIALDDEAVMAALEPIDALADTVGGATAARLVGKVKHGGYAGYVSVMPEEAAKENPQVTVTRVFARADASTVREFADDVRDGKFVLPIGRRLPLSEAAQAHRLGEQGGIGKLLLVIR